MPKFHLLPRRSEQEHIDMLAEPGEKHFVRLEVSSPGFGPITIAGKSTKSYVFRRNSQAGCHSLRIPMSLWMADNSAMARDLMTKPGPRLYQILPLFEIATEAEQPPQEESPPEEPPAPPVEPPASVPAIPEYQPDPSAEDEEEAPPPAPPAPLEPSAGTPAMLMHDDEFDIGEIPEVDDNAETPQPQQPQPARRGRPRKSS